MMIKPEQKPEPVRIARSYEAPLRDLWELWTTKEGFEAWWGPEGFAVEVHELDARVGGKLLYDMIAVGEEQIAFMKQANMPLSHETRGTYTRVEPMSQLTITHLIDFIDGLEPYANDISVSFRADGSTSTMVVEIAPHTSEYWTKQSVMGFESQLTKVPAALAAMARAYPT